MIFSVFENPGRDGLIFSSSWFWHGFVMTTLFSGAAFWGVVYYPDWMWMYFTHQSQNSHMELLYLFVFLYYFPFCFGFYLGLDLRKISGFFWFVMVVMCVLTEMALVIHLFDRYSVIGTREQYYLNTAVSLFSSDHKLSLVMNVSGVMMVAYFIFVLYLAKKNNRRRLSRHSHF